jgi:hypothetical protein
MLKCRDIGTADPRGHAQTTEAATSTGLRLEVVSVYASYKTPGGPTNAPGSVKNPPKGARSHLRHQVNQLCMHTCDSQLLSAAMPPTFCPAWGVQPPLVAWYQSAQL